MQQALPAAAAVLLAIWLLRRRRPPLMPSLYGQAVAALNRAQIERAVLDPDSVAAAAPDPAAEVGAAPESGAVPDGFLPGGRLDPRQHGRLLRELAAAARAGEGERLAALATCAAWGDRASLPLLRRARFDPDPRVAALAARGLALFRGRTAAAGTDQPARPPRNVARTL
jgi:hypothetical protein